MLSLLYTSSTTFWSIFIILYRADAPIEQTEWPNLQVLDFLVYASV